MLREIKKKEFMKMLPGKVVLLCDGKSITFKEAMGAVGVLSDECRILIDEDPEQKKEAAEEEKPKKKRGPKPGEGRKKYEGSSEEAILKAWNGGERTAKEIAEMTGFSLQTVYKYIPRTPNG